MNCGVVWCGVVLCGVVWCGVVWCGVVWCGVVWCGVVWCGVVWCGVVWCGVVRCGVVWCGAVWCGGVVSDLCAKQVERLYSAGAAGPTFGPTQVQVTWCCPQLTWAAQRRNPPSRHPRADEKNSQDRHRGCQSHHGEPLGTHPQEHTCTPQQGCTGPKSPGATARKPTRRARGYQTTSCSQGCFRAGDGGLEGWPSSCEWRRDTTSTHYKTAFLRFWSTSASPKCRKETCIPFTAMGWHIGLLSPLTQPPFCCVSGA